jgi:hypothetical protein
MCLCSSCMGDDGPILLPMPPVPRVNGISARTSLPTPQGAPFTPNARPAFEPNHAKQASRVPGVNQRYTLTLGAASAGTFTLTPNGQGPTGAIAFNADAATVDAALEAVVGAGNVQVTGGTLPGGTLTIEFTGSLRESPRALTGAFGGLTGATPALTQTQAGVLAVFGAPVGAVRGGQVGRR